MSDLQTPGTAQVVYRRLGSSGLRVSVPILGCMSFGSSDWLDWVINEAEALPLLKAAWDRGINTWDTANLYSNGESERIIGKAIKQFAIPRERLILLTKCHFLVAHNVGTITKPEMADTRDYTNQSGLSRAAIFNQVNASLARLGTDYIDLFQIHRADLENSTAEETMKALHDLVQSGKVRYLGASSMWTWQLQHYNHIAKKNGWTPFISMQNQYNLMYREEEREMIPYCKFAGIGIIPWGPLNAGRLARPLDARSTARSDGQKESLQPDEEEILRRVEKIAGDRGWLMSQVAQAWINEKITSPIVGFSSVKRMEEGIVTSLRLTEEESQYLEAPYQPKTIRGHS